jgi:hypothetical protein
MREIPIKSLGLKDEAYNIVRDQLSLIADLCIGGSGELYEYMRKLFPAKNLIQNILFPVDSTIKAMLVKILCMLYIEDEEHTYVKNTRTHRAYQPAELSRIQSIYK